MNNNLKIEKYCIILEPDRALYLCFICIIHRLRDNQFRV